MRDPDREAEQFVEDAVDAAVLAERERRAAPGRGGSVTTLPPETRLAMLESLTPEERCPRWAEERAAVVASIDHVVTRPVLHWAQMWQDMAEWYAEPPEEILVMLTGQTHPRDNGPWLVRADGSRRRPDVSGEAAVIW